MEFLKRKKKGKKVSHNNSHVRKKRKYFNIPERKIYRHIQLSDLESFIKDVYAEGLNFLISFYFQTSRCINNKSSQEDKGKKTRFYLFYWSIFSF